MKKYIIILFLFTSVLILTSCVNPRVEQMKQEMITEFRKIEPAEEVALITTTGYYSSEVTYEFEPIILQQLKRDKKIENAYEEKKSYFTGTKFFYYNNKVFIVRKCVIPEKNDVHMMWIFDMNDFSFQYLYFNEFNEMYNKNIQIGGFSYCDDNYITVKIEIDEHSIKYLLYDYIENKLQIFSTLDDTYRYINVEPVKSEPKKYIYNGVKYNFDVAGYIFLPESYDYSIGRIEITSQYNFKRSINYDYIVNRSKEMKKIDNIIGDKKKNIEFTYYYEGEDLYLLFYDTVDQNTMNFAFPGSFMFKYDIMTDVFTYYGYFLKDSDKVLKIIKER